MKSKNSSAKNVMKMTPRIGYYVGRKKFINIPTQKVGRHILINIPIKIKKTFGVDCTNIPPNLLKIPATNTKGRNLSSKLSI
jgi:hypothetical protein